MCILEDFPELKTKDIPMEFFSKEEIFLRGEIVRTILLQKTAVRHQIVLTIHFMSKV